MCVIYEPPDGGWDPYVPGGSVLIVTHPEVFEWGDDWLVPNATAVAESVRPDP